MRKKKDITSLSHNPSQMSEASEEVNQIVNLFLSKNQMTEEEGNLTNVMMRTFNRRYRGIWCCHLMSRKQKERSTCVRRGNLTSFHFSQRTLCVPRQTHNKIKTETTPLRYGARRSGWVLVV
jgi:hypothetical protein